MKPSHEKWHSHRMEAWIRAGERHHGLDLVSRFAPRLQMTERRVSLTVGQQRLNEVELVRAARHDQALQARQVQASRIQRHPVTIRQAQLKQAGQI